MSKHMLQYTIQSFLKRYLPLIFTAILITNFTEAVAGPCEMCDNSRNNNLCMAIKNEGSYYCSNNDVNNLCGVSSIFNKIINNIITIKNIRMQHNETMKPPLPLLPHPATCKEEVEKDHNKNYYSSTNNDTTPNRYEPIPPCHISYMHNIVLALFKDASNDTNSINNKKICMYSIKTLSLASWSLFHICNDGNPPTSIGDYIEIYTNWFALVIIDYIYDKEDEGKLTELLDLKTCSHDDSLYYIKNVFNILLDISMGATQELSEDLSDLVENKDELYSNQLSILKTFYKDWKTCESSSDNHVLINKHPTINDIAKDVTRTFKEISTKHVFLRARNDSTCIGLITITKDKNYRLFLPSLVLVETHKESELLTMISKAISSANYRLENKGSLIDFFTASLNLAALDIVSTVSGVNYWEHIRTATFKKHQLTHETN